MSYKTGGTRSPILCRPFVSACITLVKALHQRSNDKKPAVRENEQD